MHEMKDSGIEWIGEIPNNRLKCKIKNVCAFIGSGTTPPSHNYLFYDGEIFWIQSGDLYGNSFIRDTSVKVTKLAVDACSSLKIYKAPYIVIAMYGGSVGNMSIASIDACVNQATCCLCPNRDTYLKFLYYWLNVCKVDFLAIAVGGGQPNISQNKIKNEIIFIPDFSEQQAIADFLDAKCAEIDALSSDIQAQIDTLEQYKRSVISEAVTKGLDPNVPMKDSGIEWVGEIPASWDVLRGKYVFVQRNQKGNSKQLQLLSPTQKYGVIPQERYEELSGMRAVKLNEQADLALMKTIHTGDFCISLRSFQGGFEYCECEGVVSPAYQVFYSVKPIVNGYYKYLFKETGFIEKMNSYTMTLRDGKNIAFDDFGNTYIPVPSLPEQQAIADYLDAKCSEIDQVIAQKQEQLSTLADYKKSLIYEYVTGKKEVPAS